MAETTIEWQMTTQGYHVGDVTAVERTEFIDNLIEQGVAIEVDNPASAGVFPGETTVPGDTPHAAEQLGAAPKRNASREAWAEFLDRANVTYPQGDDVGRDDLLEAWDAHVAAAEAAAAVDPADD